MPPFYNSSTLTENDALSAIFGWFGLLLAVPAIAIIQELLRYYLIEKKQDTS